jgi:hypothetical protein
MKGIPFLALIAFFLVSCQTMPVIVFGGRPGETVNLSIALP